MSRAEPFNRQKHRYLPGNQSTVVPPPEGKDIAASTLKVLKEYGYTSKQDKVYLQCFDANELKRIKNELEPKMGMDLNLVQLIAYTDWNETQQKQADGKWVNYSYDWMFKPGRWRRLRSTRTASARITICW